MKKYITLIMLMGALIPAGAQAQTLSLDSCRAMALRNNKQVLGRLPSTFIGTPGINELKTILEIE